MIHTFDPIIYPRKVWITYDATVDELNTMFPSGNAFKEENVYYGITYARIDKDNNCGVLIRFPNNKDAVQSWHIIHEAIHAAGYICDYIGIKADFKNDEAFTYLATWIAECCEKVIREEKNPSTSGKSCAKINT